MNDDFSTPEVFARVFEVVRIYNNLCKPMSKVTPDSHLISSDFKRFVTATGQLMSLFQEAPAQYLTNLDDMLLTNANLVRADIETIFQARMRAREAKDFAKSDELRKKLTEMGIAVQDGPEGSSWEVQK